MHDPHEGVTTDGLIRTGVPRAAIAPIWKPVLQAAVDAVAGRASLEVHGSVATGCGQAPTSDVDLLSVRLASGEAKRIRTELSTRYRDRCREVSIATASWTGVEGAGDESHGLRVFLRHDCVHLAGADPAQRLPAYPVDRRAARGFNGDIAQHLQRWRRAVDGRCRPRSCRDTDRAQVPTRRRRGRGVVRLGARPVGVEQPAPRDRAVGHPGTRGRPHRTDRPGSAPDRSIAVTATSFRPACPPTPTDRRPGASPRRYRGRS